MSWLLHVAIPVIVTAILVVLGLVYAVVGGIVENLYYRRVDHER